MKVLVFGANGRVGSKVVEKLLRDGHQIRAFVHSNSSLTEHKDLEIVEGDVHNTKHVSEALEGQEIVISALGSWGTQSKDILSAAMENIVPAMRKANVQRIISLTGSGAIAPNDSPTVVDKLNRTFIRLAASKILEDGERHIAILANSTLNWTVVRSPAMRNSARIRYVLSKRAPSPWVSISREAVAEAMVHLIDDSQWFKAAPYIRTK